MFVVLSEKEAANLGKIKQTDAIIPYFSYFRSPFSLFSPFRRPGCRRLPFRGRLESASGRS
jgi:hypothetical protein